MNGCQNIYIDTREWRCAKVTIKPYASMITCCSVSESVAKESCFRLSKRGSHDKVHVSLERRGASDEPWPIFALQFILLRRSSNCSGCCFRNIRLRIARARPESQIYGLEDLTEQESQQGRMAPNHKTLLTPKKTNDDPQNARTAPLLHDLRMWTIG
jgi:hypothetical protein